MTEFSAAPKNASAPQASCFFPTCCAKLELGSLFCKHCSTSGLLELLANVGLESEEIELPAPAAN